MTDAQILDWLGEHDAEFKSSKVFCRLRWIDAKGSHYVTLDCTGVPFPGLQLRNCVLKAVKPGPKLP